MRKMYKLCRIDIGKCEEIRTEKERFSAEMKEKFNCKVYFYCSFVRGGICEGSDINMIIVGVFKELVFDRIGMIHELTDLPIESLVCTREDFDKMKRYNLVIRRVLDPARRLV
jgi:predicted nucleotidyltransferase